MVLLCLSMQQTRSKADVSVIEDPQLTLCIHLEAPMKLARYLDMPRDVSLSKSDSECCQEINHNITH